MYVIVYPPKNSWSGYMCLIPGMFQKPMDVLTQTELPKYAARQGILAIIPTFKTGISSIGVDSASQSSLIASNALFNCVEPKAIHSSST